MKVVIAAAAEAAHIEAEVRRVLEADGPWTVVSHAGDAASPENDPPDAPPPGNASAEAVACAVAVGAVDRAVLIDPTGIGVLIAANRVRGVRAALARTPLEAEVSRRQFDANVLCLGESASDLGRLLSVWLATPFDGGEEGRPSRHFRRVAKIAALEDGVAAGEPQRRCHPGAAAGYGRTAPDAVPV